MTVRTNLRHRTKSRRLGVLDRLERQLASGRKGEKKDIDLTDKDRDRINEQITTLKERTR